MMKKTETAEMLKKRKAREAKELAKWERERQKPKMKGYGLYILFLLTLIQCIDNIATSINTQMQSAIAVGLFQDRLSIMSLLTALAMPILILSVFYKSNSCSMASHSLSMVLKSSNSLRIILLSSRSAVLSASNRLSAVMKCSFKSSS